MKKILSILICVVLGISSAWADQYTHTINVYARNGNVSTEGGGTVTAQGGYYGDIDVQWNDGAVKSSTTTVFSTSTTTEEQSYWAFGTRWKTGKFQMTATPFAGYYFSHWTGNTANSTSTLSGWSQSTGWKTIDKQGSAKTFYYYAIFKPVGVSNASAATISTVDYPSSNTVTVSFPVTNADNINDFQTPTVTGEGFSIDSYSYANNTVSVIVRFTNFNKDNVNGTSKPTFAGTVTLKSAGGENSGTCTITATSDLTPEFTATPSPCDLTPNDPVEDGHTVNATINTSFTKTITGNANNVWSAYFANPTQASDLGYSLDATDPKNPKVSFSPTAQSINKPNVETQLCIKCVYTDATPKDVPYILTITLSADAGKVFTINTLQEAIMNFDVIDYSATNNPATMTFPIFTTMEESDFTRTENLTGGVTIATTIAGLASTTDKIDVTAPSTTTPGEYISTVRYQETDGDLWAQLTINVPVKLAKPVVTATNLGQGVQLNWQEVYGATSYIVKSGETVVATIGDDEAIATTYRVTNIGGKSLVMGREYPFTVTAVYNTAEHFGTRISNEIIVTPIVPNTITASTDFDLYTGTDKYQEGHATYGKYPYAPKRKIDLSAAFNNGVAAFDQLFVFGLTIGNADGVVTVPTATANSNAVTPCYIYTKSGDNYVLSSSSIDNVNVATKPAAFNISANGQKIYFTGYAPYASCGSTWDENAVFLFTGNGKAVDVYFDNLELYARPKAVTGTTVPIKKYTVASFNDAMGLLDDKDVNLDLGGPSLNVYVQGSGAAFAFASTGGTLTPTIHLNGTNVLQSTAGVSVHVLATWALSVDQTASQQSSPIQVLTKKDGGAATLTITDTWFDANTHTNGILDLAKSGVRPAPTIDLGNEKTTLNFRGGQYFLANAGNTSVSYTVTYAISYRKKSMQGGMANMYAVGDDQPEGKVRFYDGSVNCSLLPNAYFNKDLYHNQTSMKCPKDTKIDGGTFNCDVLSCTATESKGGSPTNSAGKALCKVSVPIQETNSNGTAVLASDWMSYAASHGANTSDLGDYGIKSLQPTTIINDDEEEVSGVNLMLPSDNVCFVEMTRAPWVMCFPPISMTTTLGSATLGGSQTVLSSVTAGDEGLTHIQLTSRLFYGELDEYVADAVSSGYTSPGGTGVELSDGEGNQHILNTSSYVIKDKIYWVRPVVANEWRMIVPPFDVANIYIVEAYPEQQLLTDFGDGKTISGEGNIYDARLAQSERIIDLFYYWFFDCDPGSLANDNDLWPKKGWDMSPFIRDWIDYETGKYDDAEDKAKYRPTIDQLYHFTGSNWEANYYLYESDGKWDYVDGKFVTDWQLVQAQSVKRGTGTPQTIMHKGGIYAMCFPYSIYNDGSHNPDKVWDYWTGKYIIMEGYPTNEVDIIGPAQVLSGTTSDWNGAALSTTIMADHTATGASLRGNHTFGKVSVQKNNAFYLNGTNKYTNSDKKRDLEPGEGFLLANAGKVPLSMPNRKASIDLMTGDVTYEPVDGSENGATSTPTIAGEREMLVYTVAGGLGVVPVVPQYVSIYNAAGQLVVSQYLTDNTQFALPTGIYLVRGEKDQAKAMVK